MFLEILIKVEKVQDGYVLTEGDYQVPTAQNFMQLNYGRAVPLDDKAEIGLKVAAVRNQVFSAPLNEGDITGFHVVIANMHDQTLISPAQRSLEDPYIPTGEKRVSASESELGADIHNLVLAKLESHYA